MSQNIIGAFTAGEMSTDIDSSTELDKYRYGLKECTNMIVNPLGGVKNRPGIQYIADCHTTSKLSRIVSFQFNTEQAYILEFGDLVMRIIVDGALVGAPTVITSPYAIADVQDLVFVPSADVIFVYHPDYPTYQIRRTSDTAWTIFKLGDTGFTGNHNGPYIPREDGDEDIRIKVQFVSGGSPYWAITSSAVLFGDMVVDDVFKLGFPVTGDLEAIRWSHFQVSATSSSTFLEAQVIDIGNGTIFYEQIQNYDFKDGIEFWEEHSIAPSKITHDFTNKRLVMTDGSGGSAKTEQIVLVQSRVPHTLSVVITAVTGTTHQVTISVGTTSFGVEIMPATIVSTVATHSYDIVPIADTIYVSFDTTGSTDGDTVEIFEVSLRVTPDYKVGELPLYYTTEYRLPKHNVANGFPSTAIISGQRLISANIITEPQTIWASQLGGYVEYDESTPSQSTDSFSFIPAVGELNGLLWMVEHDGLKAGTSNEIFSIYASSGGVITPTDINTKIVSAVGSLDLRPLVIGNSLIMTPRGHEAVSEMTASNEAQGYIPRDLSILASHLFEDRRIVRWVYARNPDSIIWCVLDNGELLGLTYKKEYDVWAWHRHTTPLGEGFKDIAIIPNSSDDNIDEVYFVINRAELGETPNYYIEKLNKRITSQTAAFGLSASGTPYDYKFLDSALTSADALVITGATSADPVVITSTAHTYLDGDEIRIQNVLGMTELNNNVYTVTNKAANTYELYDSLGGTIDGTAFTTYLSGGESRKMITAISGLGHLEGQTVTALADGRVQENLVVTSGSVTLSQSASFIHIGLSYQSKIETLDLELLTQQGSSQGRLKSITKADIYFKDTRQANCAAGSNPDEIRPIEFQNEAFGEIPPPLFNGVKETTVPGNSSKQETLIITQDKPLPIYIKRIVADVDYER